MNYDFDLHIKPTEDGFLVTAQFHDLTDRTNSERRVKHFPNLGTALTTIKTWLDNKITSSESSTT